MSQFHASRFTSLGLVSLVLMGLGACQKQEVAEAPPVVRPVKVVKAEMSAPTRQVAYSGTVKARTQAAMGFRVSGKVVARLVNLGQHVAPGDVLARLDTTDLDLNVRSAQSQLDAARAQRDLAQLSFDRAAKLNADGYAAKSVLDSAQMQLDQAKSSVVSAEAQLNAVKNQSSYAELKADGAGIVTAINADVGQVVSAGSPVMVIDRDGEKEVAVSVPETEIDFFHTGDRLKATFFAVPGLGQEATIREIAGSADPASRTYAMRVSLGDLPQIRLGMTATLGANIPDGTGGIVLPLAALAKVDGKPTVWVVDPATKTVSARVIVTGNFADSGFRVESGLKGGELVVSAGTQFMEQGKTVKLSETEPEAAALN